MGCHCACKTASNMAQKKKEKKIVGNISSLCIGGSWDHIRSYIKNILALYKIIIIILYIYTSALKFHQIFKRFICIKILSLQFQGMSIINRDLKVFFFSIWRKTCVSYYDGIRLKRCRKYFKKYDVEDGCPCTLLT